MHTDIANLEVPPNEAGNVRYRQYILFDGNGNNVQSQIQTMQRVMTQL